MTSVVIETSTVIIIHTFDRARGDQTLGNQTGLRPVHIHLETKILHGVQEHKHT